MSSAPKPRPKYYDLNLAHLPPPGLVSILHRVSGMPLPQFLAERVFAPLGLDMVVDPALRAPDEIGRAHV